MRSQAVILAAALVASLVAAAASAPSDRVIFWQHSNEKGTNFWSTGGLLPHFGEFDNWVSTVEVQGNCYVTVYKEPNFGGESWVFYGGSHNLHPDWWNDQLSSAIVVCNGKVDGQVVVNRKGGVLDIIFAEFKRLGNNLRGIDFSQTAQCMAQWGGVIACLANGGGPACAAVVPRDDPCYQFLTR